MRSTDSSPWPPAAAAPARRTRRSRRRRSADGAAAPAGGGRNAGRDELERWLCEPGTPVPSLDEMACAFGLSFDATDGEGVGHRAPPPHRLRFALAVLRDAFPDDGALRRWLREPNADAAGERPLEILLGGRVERLEELAVGEWNRRWRATPA